MTQLGLMMHVDPYLLDVFYRPKELELFATPPVPDPETLEDGISSGNVWSMREDWADLDLTDEGRSLVDAIVPLIEPYTASVHEAHDYPCLVWIGDDQLMISVHPLDRASAFSTLHQQLMMEWEVVMLPGMGGSW